MPRRPHDASTKRGRSHLANYLTSSSEREGADMKRTQEVKAAEEARLAAAAAKTERLRALRLARAEQEATARPHR